LHHAESYSIETDHGRKSNFPKRKETSRNDVSGIIRNDKDTLHLHEDDEYIKFSHPDAITLSYGYEGGPINS
jgi:hypothetical protein